MQISFKCMSFSNVILCQEFLYSNHTSSCSISCLMLKDRDDISECLQLNGFCFTIVWKQSLKWNRQDDCQYAHYEILVLFTSWWLHKLCRYPCQCPKKSCAERILTHYNSQDVPRSMWGRGVSFWPFTEAWEAQSICKLYIKSYLLMHGSSFFLCKDHKQNETMVNGSLLANEILMDPMKWIWILRWTYVSETDYRMSS